MKRIAIALLVVATASVALAGGNPDVRVYIDFDPPNYVHAVQPQPFTTVNAYLCLDQLDSGMTTLCVGLTDLAAEYPGVVAAGSWVSLLPGGIPISWPWDAMMPNSTECMIDADGRVVVGYASYFYLSGAACLEILDHPDYPRWVVDCSDPGEVDTYCVLSNGSIGGGVCPEGDCIPVPVESGTWGLIKSLYR